MAKLPKKPKSPKSTAALGIWENYAAKVKEWEKRIGGIEADRKKKHALITKLRKAK